MQKNSLVHYFQKTNLKRWVHIHQSMIRLPRARRGRTAVWFQTNSSHMFWVELALKAVLYARLGSRGSLRHGFTPFIDPTAMPCWWAPINAKQLSVVTSARVIWLGACVGWCMCAPCLHYFKGNFRLCHRIKFNLFFINNCNSWHF